MTTIRGFSDILLHIALSSFTMEKLGDFIPGYWYCRLSGSSAISNVDLGDVEAIWLLQVATYCCYLC